MALINGRKRVRRMKKELDRVRMGSRDLNSHGDSRSLRWRRPKSSFLIKTNTIPFQFICSNCNASPPLVFGWGWGWGWGLIGWNVIFCIKHSRKGFLLFWVFCYDGQFYMYPFADFSPVLHSLLTFSVYVYLSLSNYSVI